MAQARSTQEKVISNQRCGSLTSPFRGFPLFDHYALRYDHCALWLVALPFVLGHEELGCPRFISTFYHLG